MHYYVCFVMSRNYFILKTKSAFINVEIAHLLTNEN
ncbi:hypothetical protein ERHA54_24800 [Erwinia rhapontici]|uniref:Uncharacterized protein n=1 Tax=Erwinia rhapontici TaxID=55212 RepID=A0ABN6DMA5_ERWRD|nr:hypothetical protein [Erwinia rhapontici]MCS3606113.1 hypothetical protein [Erwinia rhapontici]TDS92888.1 hypothetical protein EDF84_11260 [Erwinia rhapontici]BCQ34983.1 hypothetical protein ERHA53_23260 [Erwinia rhapontici]BCQ39877.1 hypothetical protein ERHA54_24800 [Erwinia rhapontici]